MLFKIALTVHIPEAVLFGQFFFSANIYVDKLFILTLVHLFA